MLEKEKWVRSPVEEEEDEDDEERGGEQDGEKTTDVAGFAVEVDADEDVNEGDATRTVEHQSGPLRGA